MENSTTRNGVALKPPVTLLRLNGKHNVGLKKPKKWAKSMGKDDFFKMLTRFDMQYKCKIEIFQRSEGVFLVIVQHEAGSTDKILARPIR